ncbi:substrate-binding periplasmic protein [Rappaport israeli]|uniref:substrate-binding periplasmic protein n=1 Tax=Rappaport israeli TaxID=1839807 RepID=UPI000AB3FC66|nr:transporter substrate-binding domain-containing protein [Rappaport israeli]
MYKRSQAHCSQWAFSKNFHLIIKSITILSKTLKTIPKKIDKTTKTIEQDKEGNTTGFEYELVQKIAELEGFELELVPVVFPQVFDQLKRKEVDFIGWVFKTEERVNQNQYAFTEPHNIEKLVLLASNEHEKFDDDPLTSNIKISTLNFSPLEDILNSLHDERSNVTVLPVQNLFLHVRLI